jgi:hypothetical protein
VDRVRRCGHTILGVDRSHEWPALLSAVRRLVITNRDPETSDAADAVAASIGLVVGVH